VAWALTLKIVPWGGGVGSNAAGKFPHKDLCKIAPNKKCSPSMQPATMCYRSLQVCVYVVEMKCLEIFAVYQIS
jgi:hypothetical protein